MILVYSAETEPLGRIIYATDIPAEAVMEYLASNPEDGLDYLEIDEAIMTSGDYAALQSFLGGWGMREFRVATEGEERVLVEVET